MERSELYKLLNDLLLMLAILKEYCNGIFLFPFLSFLTREGDIWGMFAMLRSCDDKSSRVTMLTPGTIRGQLAGTETLWWMGRAIKSDHNMSRRDSWRIILQSGQVTILSLSHVPCIIVSSGHQPRGQTPDVSDTSLILCSLPPAGLSVISENSWI